MSNPSEQAFLLEKTYLKAFADLPSQLPVLFNDEVDFQTSYQNVRSAVGSSQVYVHIIVPYEASTFEAWKEFDSFSGTHSKAKKTKDLREGERALLFRHQGEWAELEYTFAHTDFPGMSTYGALEQLSSLYPELRKSHRAFLNSTRELQGIASDEFFLPFFTKLHGVIGFRIMASLLQGEPHELKALSSFIQEDEDLLSTLRASSGLLDVMYEQDGPYQVFLHEDMPATEGDEGFIEELMELWEGFSSDGRVMLYLGDTFLQQSQLDKAEEAYNIALKDQHLLRLDLVWKGKAAIHMFREESEKAQEAIDKGFQIHPDCVELLLLQAQLDEEQGEIEKAIERLEKAHASDPDFPGLSYHLGKLLMQDARLDEALEVLRHEVKLDPEATEAIKAIIQIAEMTGDDELAREYQEKLDDSDDEGFNFMDVFESFTEGLEGLGGGLEEFSKKIIQNFVNPGGDDKEDGGPSFTLWREDGDNGGEVVFQFGPEEESHEEKPSTESVENSEPVQETKERLFEKDGWFRVDDATHQGYFDFRHVAVTYEGGTYRVMCRLPQVEGMDITSLKKLSCSGEICRLLVAEEDGEILLLFRLFPRPALRLEDWKQDWGLQQNSLLAELLEIRELSLSPSQLWDQLYRRLLALLSEHMCWGILQGEYHYLKAFSLLIQGENQALEALGKEHSTKEAEVSRDFGIIEKHFYELLSTLFSAEPATHILSLYSEKDNQLSEGHFPTVFSLPQVSSNDTPSRGAGEKIREHIQGGRYLQALAICQSSITTFQCSEELYRLRGEIYTALSHEPNEPIERHLAQGLAQRSFEIGELFGK
mgnify:CR=1 FL=1